MLAELDRDNVKVMQDGIPLVFHRVDGRYQIWPLQSFYVFYRSWVHQEARNGKKHEIEVSKLWIKDVSGARAWRTGITFDPSGKAHSGKLNIWVGFPVQAAPGDVSLLLEHVKNVIADGDPQLANWILDWLAHSVQRPTELPGTGLILRGAQGIGKSAFAGGFAGLWGRHGMVLRDREHLVGRFTEHLAGKVAVVLEDSVLTPDLRNRDVAEKVKSLLTVPTISLEPKGRPLFETPNYMRVMCCTNAEWAALLDTDDRRWTVADVSSVKRGDVEYFKRLHGLFESEAGKAAILHYLLNRDISKFNPRKAFTNAAKRRQQEHSLSPVEKAIMEILTEATPETWDTRPWCSDLLADIRQRTGLQTVGSQALGKALHKLIGPVTSTPERRQVDGDSVTQKRYALPPLAHARAAFKQKTGLAPWEREGG